MGQQNAWNVLVIWRGKQFNVNVNSISNVKEFGQKLQELTNVRPDTMRLFVPESNNKSSKMLSPFSELHSKLSLHESAILEGKTIRMMGAFKDEIDEVSQNSKKPDLRIAGFAEEEERLRQRAMYGPQTSLKLPQGTYIFCEFRTLDIPGIKLNPPPSEALRRMHMLACDPGIIAIMNKHRWRVGIMTEMAPEGYVGISPKCILGFNKNRGEEISLRLRTDDLRGFRKYESIKKTLLHELAHMVYSEHDSNFFALNKQLNEEAASLDWTKSKSHTLNGRKYHDHYEEEVYVEAISQNSGQMLGGTMPSLASARESSVAAAYNRLVRASYDRMPATSIEPDPDDSKLKDNRASCGAEPDRDDKITTEKNAMHIDVMKKARVSSTHDVHDEPDPDDPLDSESILEPDPDDSCSRYLPVTEPDPDDSHSTDVGVTENEPDPDDSLTTKFIMESDLVGTRSIKLDTNCQRELEPDPDDSLNNGVTVDTRKEKLNLGNYWGEPDPDDSAKGMVYKACERLQQGADCLPASENLMAVGPVSGLDNQELQRIEEPATLFCSRLQRAIDILRSEVTPLQATSALQTLFKIIRNVIEHPDEIKFRRLRKANPQFQRNVANYRAAMEVLTLVGFYEDIISDEIGRTETFLVLKRNDPGLLWLAKSSLELSMA
ncbi:hypothetical protein Cni_G28261 [Canna indica]|uniref:WLM domain-containing protein n=1 Tax=Canna indica TaxID=4628 RepID=A0AAQ3L6C7_9LILI|nr:hypothetical protein Cni_G28261 [Canna indica]